jgi:predicted aldo/keto reductase-like oxidoreductase
VGNFGITREFEGKKVFQTALDGESEIKIKRRKFLKVVAGISIGTVVTGCTKDSEKPTKGIGLRQLGRTDLQLTPVGYGAQHTRDSELIRYAIDQGINYIETAWGYGFGQPGNSCESTGKAISGVRDKVYLFVAYMGRAPRTSKAWVGNQFEQTLRDLATDYIDVFLWHQPESIEEMTKGEHIDLVEKWKSEGQIRWCGITAHENQEVYLKHVAESSLYDVAVVAFNSNSSPELAQSIKEAAQEGVGIIAMKTQSPNYNRPPHAIGDSPDHRKALSWVLSNNYVVGAIPGMTTKEQVDMNVQVMKNLQTYD